MKSTMFCPICKAEKAENPRYPNYVCHICALDVSDELGRLLKIVNTNIGDGISVTCGETGEERSSRECFVRGVRCFVKQAHLGGVVIQTFP